MGIRGVLVAGAALAVLGAPAAASASIVYTQGNNIFVADDLARNPRLIASGAKAYGGEISLNGRTIRFFNAGALYTTDPAGTFTKQVLPATAAILKGNGPRFVSLTPDGGQIALFGAHGEFEVMPARGGKRRRLAKRFISDYSFSPNSKRIVYQRRHRKPHSFTDVNDCVIQVLKTRKIVKVPVANAIHPLWGRAGIVVASYSPKTNIYRLLLLDHRGHRKRQLFKRRLPDSEVDYDIPGATLITQNKVLTSEARRNDSTRIRTYSTHSGKQISSLDLPGSQSLYFDPDGDRVLTVSNSGGELDTVNLRTGARTMLIASGVSFPSTD